MAITAVLQSATPNRAVFLLTGDGVDTTLTLANATLLTDLNESPGALRDAFNATYANQAAMRAVIGGGLIDMKIIPRSLTSAGAADVDTDAVTTTKPEINLTALPATAFTAYLVIQRVHSLAQ